VVWRRVANLFVVVAIATASGGTYAAAAATASVQVSQGAVDLTRSSGDNGESTVYTVNFHGWVTDHGWSHTGTLTGVGSTWAWAAGMGSTPILSMSSDDNTISGRCAGSSDTIDEVATGALHMDFGCVLSRNGGTPWQITLESALIQDLNDAAIWTGRYDENDVATPQANLRGTLSYGGVQLGDASGLGYFQWGPLRFSGQINIGGTLYRGDLVSGMSDPTASNDVPPLAVSGSSNGLDVTGTCSGAFDQTVGQVADGFYEFTCNLAVGSAAPATVSLKTALVSGTGACSYRDCWGDHAGHFTAG
jgi:hypothetical protein